MPGSALRVVLAEDGYLVREGVRRVLEASGEVEVVAAVGNTEELLDAVRRLSPDAVVTDIRMPPTFDMEGIRAAHVIRSEWPDVAVVVLSQYADAAYAVDLLGRGAAGLGYLLKDRVGDYETLIDALRATVAGRSVIDADMVETLVARRQRAEASRIARLTPRELDVLRAMAEGGTNTAIAQALHLSASAIEKHIGSIFDKLGIPPEPLVHRRVAAVVTYLRYGAPIKWPPQPDPNTAPGR
ncbi:MAG: response regulator transcription factor [Sporichthyaceae bacterium]|nr:response regulator transcription factor [Sporichthyaceae bacterium]